MTKFPSYKILSVDSLIPYARNSRTHSADQVARIASSIVEFGFLNPVIVDGANGIIAGHGRILAAQLLGITEVPAVEADHLTDAQRRAYIIADNKLALDAGWDDAMLRIEFDDLLEAGFDIELTGFTLDEIADMTPEVIEPGLTDEDAVPDVPVEPKSVPGDVWLLGNHRLMCGDSTSIDAVEKLMDGVKADMVFTDPPYGISIVSGGWVGGGERNNIPFGDTAKGETQEQKAKRLGTVGGSKPFGSKKDRGTDGASNMVECNRYAPVAGDDSIDVAIEAIHVISTLNAKVEIIWGGNYYAAHLANSSCWIVWDKQNTGNFADAELAWTNQKTAVRIFKHMWNGMVKASEHGQKRVHPTQKPIALAEWCFDQYGGECDTVLDLFGGSGFTLMACETRKKTGYIMEITPAYIDVIIKRWQDFTGKQAIHAETGVLFNEL